MNHDAVQSSARVATSRSIGRHGQIEMSREGWEFDVSSAMWKLSAHVSLNVGRLRTLFAPPLSDGLIKTFCHLARKQSPRSCVAAAENLKAYVTRMSSEGPLAAWRMVDLIAYREHLAKHSGQEGQLIKLRAFIKTWHKLRHPGVDRDVFEALSEMSLKAAKPGRAVREDDPRKGPLDPTEFHTFTKDLTSAYERGSLDHTRFAIAEFHVATGRRPVQGAHLKCKDLDDSRDADLQRGLSATDAQQNRLLLMHVPRAKQHGATFRDESRSVEWTSALFAVFRLQQRNVESRFESTLREHGWALQPQDLARLKAELPLFPRWDRVNATLGTLLLEHRHGEALDLLQTTAASEQWHMSSEDIARTLRAVAKLAGTRSRAGDLLHITAQRLRYTKGTDLAREGAGRDLISWLLDHSGLESASIYIDNLPEHAIPVNAAMALSPTMQGLAMMFRGKLVDREEDAEGGKDPRSSRIHFKGEGAATCGTRKQCGMGSRIPYCCYPCDHFRPWLEGPHLEVLGEMLVERRRREATLGADHTVTRNADVIIVAIINVVQRCETRSRELADGVSASVTPK